MNSYILSSIIAITGGFTISTYKEYAIKNGWPIGKLYFSQKGWLTVIALLSIVGGSIELFTIVKWYSAIGLIFISFFLSWLITIIIKSNIQWIAFLLLALSLLIYLIGGAETVKV